MTGSILAEMLKIDNPEEHIEAIAGQVISQSKLAQILMSQLVFLSADRGAGVRKALEVGIGVMQRNPNMTTGEKFGAVKTLEDALDTLNQVYAAMLGSVIALEMRTMRILAFAGSAESC